MTIQAADLIAVTKAVTKKWAQQRKAEERGSKSWSSRAYVYSDRVYFTDVAASILPAGYDHASGGGQYTVSKRQLFYAVREPFRERTGRALTYGYFADTLLVQYRNRHPETASWKITADPRGTLTIPNADHEVRVPCGTLAIDAHLAEAGTRVNPLDIDTELSVVWPSLAGGQRYRGVLYIEKEGFEPLFQEARIADRFDLAILSCKGQSVVAGRKFVDEVCAAGGGVPLLVIHDMDKFGFEISQRLTRVSDQAEARDRVTYYFRNEIDVIDLGLRLADAEAFGLTGEECHFTGGFASDSIATKREQAYLRSGRRIELNEFTSPQFLEWLEGKLGEHLPGRLIPDDGTLEEAYRRAFAIARFNAVVEAARDEILAEAREARLPRGLRRKIAKAQRESDGGAWDQVLYRLAEQEAAEEG
jgi:hypothetical protein